MGNSCCGGSTESDRPELTPEERQLRRERQKEAAEKRANSFKQGGGGERLKEKSKRREEAERLARERKNDHAMKWTMN